MARIKKNENPSEEVIKDEVIENTEMPTAIVAEEEKEPIAIEEAVKEEEKIEEEIPVVEEEIKDEIAEEIIAEEKPTEKKVETKAKNTPFSSKKIKRNNPYIFGYTWNGVTFDE